MNKGMNRSIFLSFMFFLATGIPSACFAKYSIYNTTGHPITVLIRDFSDPAVMKDLFESKIADEETIDATLGKTIYLSERIYWGERGGLEYTLPLGAGNYFVPYTREQLKALANKKKQLRFKVTDQTTGAVARMAILYELPANEYVEFYYTDEGKLWFKIGSGLSPSEMKAKEEKEAIRWQLRARR